MLTENLVQIKVVNGQFVKEEAKEIVLKMISFKIQFHQLKNLTHQEKYGTNDEHSTRRIAELEAEMEHVKSVFAEYNDSDYIPVHASIDIG